MPHLDSPSCRFAVCLEHNENLKVGQGHVLGGGVPEGAGRVDSVDDLDGPCQEVKIVLRLCCYFQALLLELDLG